MQTSQRKRAQATEAGAARACLCTSAGLTEVSRQRGAHAPDNLHVCGACTKVHTASYLTAPCAQLACVRALARTHIHIYTHAYTHRHRHSLGARRTAGPQQSDLPHLQQPPQVRHLFACGRRGVRELLRQRALLAGALGGAVQLKQQLGTLLVHRDLAHGGPQEWVRGQQARAGCAGGAARRRHSARPHLCAHGPRGGRAGCHAACRRGSARTQDAMRVCRCAPVSVRMRACRPVYNCACACVFTRSNVCVHGPAHVKRRWRTPYDEP